MSLNSTSMLAFAIFLSTVVGCGGSQQAADSTQTSSSAVIVNGQDDRAAVDVSDPMNAVIGAVGMEGEPICTAFKIDTNEYITARHCVVGQDGKTIDGLSFLTTTDAEAYPIQNFTRLDEKADLAYFSVNGYHSDAKLELAASTNGGGDLSVYSAVESENKLRLVTDGNCKSVGQDPASGMIIHDCDTVPGASGSPLLANGKVIGVHLGSAPRKDALTQTTTIENVACPIDGIDHADTTKLAYDEERCHCSWKCPGRCSTHDVVEPIADALSTTRTIKVLCGYSVTLNVGQIAACTTASVGVTSAGVAALMPVYAACNLATVVSVADFLATCARRGL